MSDWNPQIVKIEKIEKHPGADSLEIATVLGDYPVITKIGEYKVGDAASYIPIDTIVPDMEQFYFLCPLSREKYEEDGEVKERLLGPKYPVGSVPEKYRRIKAKRIRGNYSQGMLTFPFPGMQVGESIVAVFNLKKWEEQEEENLPGLKNTKGANAAKPPEGWHIPKYDIDGIRKYLACLAEDEEIVLTEKLHGSNASFCHDGTRLWSKSRNFYKKQDSDDMWWDIAIRYDLENKLAQFPMMVFFGEIIGQVKGFRYDSKIEEGRLLSTVHFFDIWDAVKMRYLDYNDRVEMILKAGLSSVPELYKGRWLGKEHAYKYAEGQSTLNTKHIREGAVLVSVKERYEPRLDRRLQLKIVGEGYNLQK